MQMGMTAPMSGALAGFFAGGIATGSLRGAAVGMISGVAFGQLHHLDPSATKTLLHGMTGGLSSLLGGGEFHHGFLSAGFTQAVSAQGHMPGVGENGFSERMSNALAAAMIGGTASVISGGKFANGALTGAFSRLLNDMGRAEPKQGTLFKAKEFNKEDIDDRLKALNLEISVMNRNGFDSRLQIGQYLHTNAVDLSAEYDIELGARIFTADNGKYLIGELVTDYRSEKVNIGRSTLAGFNRRTPSGEWHSHGSNVFRGSHIRKDDYEAVYINNDYEVFISAPMRTNDWVYRGSILNHYVGRN